MIGLKRVLFLVLWVAIFLAWQVQATTVLQMNLEDLCDSSAQIFRGTVIDIEETTIAVGGGEVPALIYKMRVDEAFKGEFDTVKDVPVVEIKVLGTLKQHTANQPLIPGLPILQQGQDYLLMFAPEGPIGLTSPMGLGQGCFHVDGKSGEETAVNALNNDGLFKGMDAPGMPNSGPVAYSDLADMIRSAVEGQ